jgi:hypothetical protein
MVLISWARTNLAPLGMDLSIRQIRQRIAIQPIAIQPIAIQPIAIAAKEVGLSPTTFVSQARSLRDHCVAACRRHSRHRQSSPSTGIGSRKLSSLHQHAPSGAQVNSVPHREQRMRREGVISRRSVMAPS